MIDTKKVEFSKYENIPHLLKPVVTDPRKASGALRRAVSEMLDRYQAFSDTGVRDIEDYNKFVKLLQASREIIKDGNNSKIKALYSLIGDYINKLSYNETRRLGMYISKNLNSR